jgi:hypothetical protein
MSAKKIDRYILPILPALGVLAGLGWYLALQAIRDKLKAIILVPNDFRLSGALLVVPIGLLQAWPLLAAGAHPLSAYNPLFGGTRAAQQAIQVGWGESLDVVGDYLKRQPNADRLVTAIWYPLYVNFQAHAPGRVVNISFGIKREVLNQRLLNQADFYVDYIHARQRGFTPRILRDRLPDFVASINGIEYARVYRLKP